MKLAVMTGCPPNTAHQISTTLPWEPILIVIRILNFYSSDYLKKAYYNADVTGEVYGGNDRTHYYLNFGMDYSNDLLKYGESKNAYNMRFNVRGNVDMTLASWLKATTNAAVVFTNQYAGRGNFWGTASTLRPNWFAPLLPIDMMDTSVAQIQEYITNSNHLIDGKYLLGGTSSDMTNPFADLLAAGYVKEKGTYVYVRCQPCRRSGFFLERPDI